MGHTISKALALTCIILLGAIARRLRLVKGEDFHVLCAIVLNITIPSAILTGTRTMELNLGTFGLMLLGFSANWLMIGLAFFLRRGRSPLDKAFTIFNLPGFNVGCFALPYVQGLLGPEAIITACMFDAGNALMCTGGNYAVGLAVLGSGDRKKMLASLARITSSVPFLVYIFALIMRGNHLQLPQFAYDVMGTIAPANIFLSMFMLGVGLNLRINKEQITELLFHLRWRTVVSITLAALAAYFLPMTGQHKLAVILMLLSPATVIGIAFTAKEKGNAELAATYNSITTLISLVTMTAVVFYYSYQGLL